MTLAIGKRGFTLPEVLVMVAIISLIAALTWPQLKKPGRSMIQQTETDNEQLDDLHQKMKSVFKGQNVK